MIRIFKAVLIYSLDYLYVWCLFLFEVVLILHNDECVGMGGGSGGGGNTLLNQIPVCVFEWKTCYPYYYQNTQQYILKYVWYSK